MLPGQLRQLQRHDNKTPNSVRAKSAGPAAKAAAGMVQGRAKTFFFKQKLAARDKKRKNTRRGTIRREDRSRT